MSKLKICEDCEVAQAVREVVEELMDDLEDDPPGPECLLAIARELIDLACSMCMAVELGDDVPHSPTQSLHVAVDSLVSELWEVLGKSVVDRARNML